MPFALGGHVCKLAWLDPQFVWTQTGLQCACIETALLTEDWLDPISRCRRQVPTVVVTQAALTWAGTPHGRRSPQPREPVSATGCAGRAVSAGRGLSPTSSAVAPLGTREDDLASG